VGIRVLFRSEDTMLGTYLMALFAMLFAASSALTLIHFVSRLDTPVPEEPAKPVKTEIFRRRIDRSTGRAEFSDPSGVGDRSW
jgi:hypothetical protein